MNTPILSHNCKIKDKMKMPKTIERDENLELKEKHTISLAILDMKRKNMKYNVVVTDFHAFFVSASSSIVISS
jgi:hypothetical protein